MKLENRETSRVICIKTIQNNSTFKMVYLYENHSNVDEVTLNGFAFLLQNVIIEIYDPTK